MKWRWAGFAFVLLGVAGCARAGEDAGGIVFSADFEKEQAGKEASELAAHNREGQKLDFLVIGEGEFRVRQDEKNKVLDLTPTPLETFGLLFGATEKENIEARMRAYGTSAGRRFPVFAIGLNGVGGYMLRVNPAKKALELIKADEVQKSVPYAWTSKTWTMVALSVRKINDGAWSVQGKAWEQGKDEPKEWLLSFEDKEQPRDGRASLWGIPYSAEPIWFDDLSVRKLK